MVKGLSTLVSNKNAENTYLVGLALLQRDLLGTYSQRLFAAALELESELARRGVPVVPRSAQGEEDWPATHHIWVTASGRDEAFPHYENLWRRASTPITVSSHMGLATGCDWGRPSRLPLAWAPSTPRSWR